MHRENVSFKDVKIKIPDRNWDQGMWVTSCTGSVGWGFLGFEKKQVVEFLPPNERVEIQAWARPDDFVHYGSRALVWLRADNVKAVCIERLCVSLSSCRITFNSKVIKFCTWTNFVFSDSYICLYVNWRYIIVSRYYYYY